MKYLTIIVAIIVVIGFAPYVFALTLNRSAYGSLGGGLDWVYTDKSYYAAFKMAIFPHSIVNSVCVVGNDILINDQVVSFSGGDLAIIKSDGSYAIKVSSDDDYITSKEFSSSVMGILGPVPHFKKFERTGPRIFN
jgi:hypothetical protein